MTRDEGPLDPEAREFIEHNLLWLSHTFDDGEFAIRPLACY
jgi:hypothetical protein